MIIYVAADLGSWRVSSCGGGAGISPPSQPRWSLAMPAPQPLSIGSLCLVVWTREDLKALKCLSSFTWGVEGGGTLVLPRMSPAPETQAATEQLFS